MRQKYGQNFLIDNNIAVKIVNAADLNSGDNVLEIGPGRGILTKLIQMTANSVTCVEIDKFLFKELNDYLSSKKITNVKSINQDFLKYDILDIKYKFISNLPYNVGTAIIQKILPLQNWTTAVFTLQKEVVERLAAKPGVKEYGYISIFTSYYADTEILFNISPKCFNPQPKIISSVIKLKNKNPKVPKPIFFNFIKHAFSMRRKTILNCISSFCDISKEEATNILKNCKLEKLIRPDRLYVSDFLNLSNEINKYTH